MQDVAPPNLWNSVMKKIALVMLVTTLAGCGATPIVMKNPKNDQVIVCDGGARAREWPTGQMTADSCAQQLQAGGWTRVDGSRR